MIIGSGLSGSLLIQALANAGAAGHVTLIDTLENPCHGRRWAAWQSADTDTGAMRRFRRLLIAGASGEHEFELREHVYAVWDGDALDAATDAALHRIAGSRHRATVSAVTTEAMDVNVLTDAGSCQGDIVFDSVGIGNSGAVSAPAAYLHFTGWRVHTSLPLFDPDLLTLMDFRVPQHGEMRFVYVLPESTHTALVELTAFSGSPDRADVADNLHAYVDRLAAADQWTIVDRESGTLPLFPRHQQRRGGRHVFIGAAAGLVKASTGFGHHLMAKDAAVLADDLAAGRVPRGIRRRRRHSWMDSIFLELVVTEPAILVEALQQLFAGNPVDRVVRFLDEESALGDELRIVLSLPKVPFLRAAGRVVRWS